MIANAVFKFATVTGRRKKRNTAGGHSANVGNNVKVKNIATKMVGVECSGGAEGV